MNDLGLLSQYAREGSEQAFEALVKRYTPLVYSSAVRRAGPAHAEDITQAVFVILARKAVALRKRRISYPGGWLFRAAGYVASQAVREHY